MFGQAGISEQVFHVYQRTEDGGLLFYSATDFLVYYTVFSKYARRNGLRVLALCQMYDHIHSIVSVTNPRMLSCFYRECNIAFSKEFKRFNLLDGPLFESPFGRAEKKGEKRIRTALAYVYNNPVERKICARAEDYQWNYLAYAKTDHPFSDPIVLRKASHPMRMALQEIGAVRRRDGYLRHAQLNRLFASLTWAQKKQLADAVIRQWSCIDYNALSSYYDSFEAMLTAFASNTGSEYDIKERFDPWSDRMYGRMSALLIKKGMVRRPSEVIGMNKDRKFELLRFLSGAIMATPHQIGKYLHLPIQYV